MNISGNATTATTLQTARNINGVSFNGSADITVADSTKLPLAGGTLTDTLIGTTGRFQKNQTAGNYTTAAIWTESYGNTTTGIAFHISGNVGKFLEMRTDGILYWNGDTVIHSGNYNSWTPTLTGTGASGTWGINISGNAATATTAGSITSQANSATITATTAATADRIVLRDSSGDIFVRYGFASYLNMSHGVSGATNDTIYLLVL